jgi:hypothetical protein
LLIVCIFSKLGVLAIIIHFAITNQIKWKLLKLEKVVVRKTDIKKNDREREEDLGYDRVHIRASEFFK